MRHAFTLAALFAGIVPGAMAAQPAEFEWTKERFDLVAAADSQRGEALAEKYRCRKCHNDTGVSDDPDVPTIAGQRTTYMFKQLNDFRDGKRDDEDMIKVAKKLSDQDMADISSWYHTQERPAMVGGQAPLVVKVCDSCHDEEIVEKDDHIEVAPVLQGQIRQYLENTMLAFKQQDRSNDLFVRMQSVSHKLSDSEIGTLARYYGAPDVE